MDVVQKVFQIRYNVTLTKNDIDSKQNHYDNLIFHNYIILIGIIKIFAAKKIH